MKTIVPLFLVSLIANLLPQPAAGADPREITTTTPPVIDVQPGPAYWPRVRMWQGIPSLERAPNGRLWATWYAGLVGEGKGQNYQLLVTSADDGRTWSKPVAVYDASRQLLGGDTSDGHVWLDPRGKLWWFVQRVMAVPGAKPMRPRTTWGFYTDNPGVANPVWQGPVFVGFGNSLNKATVLADGTWLQMMDGAPPASALPAGAPAVKGASVYRFVGYDRSFEYHGSCEIRDTPFAEHMVVERRDHSLWLLARTRYGIAQGTSVDGGRTWRESPEPFTREYNVNTRFFLRKLASGNVLLVANDHAKKRANMTAMLSTDDGRTWPHKLVLDERESVSYPDGTQAPDGAIYVTYDRGRYLFDMQEILMARFTEADVKAGRLAGPASRLKQTINKLQDEGGGVRHSGETFEMLQEFERIKAGGVEAKPRLEEGKKAEQAAVKPKR
jgi:hypothetical protein